jgi:hypothetical protein
MSIESPILRSYGWHRYEDKTIAITVLDSAGAAVNLSAVALRWVLLKSQGGTVLLQKVKPGTITVSGASSNVVNIPVVAPTDYAAPLVAGVYAHELWDEDNDLLLAFGDAWLNEGVVPA